jgi:hypothetical protein
MPRYRVKITRAVTESTCVTVEALSPEAAQAVAFVALADMEDAFWTLDEGSWNAGHAYVTAIEPTDV